jgi:type II secretory pathway pseudopilin PulG
MFVKKSSRNKTRGIGLLELMLSLAIIAILLVMATRYFLVANESQKINNAVSIANGFAGAEAQYATHNNVYTNSIKTLIDGNYLPSSFGGGTAEDGKGANPWGGDLTLALNGSSPGFIMTFTKVPMGTQNPTTCAKLAQTINGSGKGMAVCSGGVVTVTFAN